MLCHDIPGLLKEEGLSTYNPNEWRPFFDGSTRSLKCVLHNDNVFGAVPIGDSVFVKNMDIRKVKSSLQYDTQLNHLC